MKKSPIPNKLQLVSGLILAATLPLAHADGELDKQAATLPEKTADTQPAKEPVIEKSEPLIAWSGNTGIWSRYMWRGLRISTGPVWESTFTASSHNVSASIWHNYDFDTGKLTEIDGTLDYAFTALGAACNVGWNHFGVIDGAESDELYLLSSWTPAKNWAVSFNVYGDVNFGLGAYTQLGVSRSFELCSRVGLKLAANAGVVWNDSYMGLNDEGKDFIAPFSGELVATLPITLNKYLTLEPRVGYTFPLSSDARQAISTYGFGSQSQTVYGALQLNFTF